MPADKAKEICGIHISTGKTAFAVLTSIVGYGTKTFWVMRLKNKICFYQFFPQSEREYINPCGMCTLWNFRSIANFTLTSLEPVKCKLEIVDRNDLNPECNVLYHLPAVVFCNYLLNTGVKEER
jgi:hypothetical protein